MYYNIKLSTMQDIIWIIFQEATGNARRPVNRMQVIDPFKMSSISAEFGSLPKTHLQLPGSRNLKLQIWQICWSFGSFAVRINRIARRALDHWPRSKSHYYLFKNGVWEFQKVEVLEWSFVQPGH